MPHLKQVQEVSSFYFIYVYEVHDFIMGSQKKNSKT
jgi:hypothetical protein